MKKILIIGTGPSGLSVLSKLIKENFIIDIVDGSENKIDNKLKWSKNYKDGLSPKYNSQSFFSENFFFKKKNKINSSNFFLSSTLSAGGGSKYWGSGLEIPDKYYYKRNKLKLDQFKNQIENSKFFFDLKKNKVLSKQINVEQKFFKKFFKNTNDLKIKELNISINKDADMDQAQNYLEKSIFNVFDKIKDKKFNKINYFNLFVKKIEKKNKFNVYFSKNIKKEYDYIFCCAGCIGSTLIVSRILNLKQNKFRIFHNPMFLLIFLSLKLFFIKKDDRDKTKMSVPSSTLVFKSKEGNYKGSMMFLKNISLKNSSFSIKNLIFNLLKKYLVGGNFFLDQNLSKTYLISNKKGFIISGTTIDIPKIIKSKILVFLIKNFCLPIPFMNFKNFKTGSDAHYTSSLFEYNKKNKILNDCSELISMKNFYILDGSVIPPGLNYPTFFQVLNNFVKLKKIKKKIFNEKK